MILSLDAMLSQIDVYGRGLDLGQVVAFALWITLDSHASKTQLRNAAKVSRKSDQFAQYERSKVGDGDKGHICVLRVDWRCRRRRGLELRPVTGRA